MKILFFLYLIVFAFQMSSCSEAGTFNSETVAVNNASTPKLNSTVTPESNLNSPETVSKNCIKKDGWLLPPSNGKLIADRSDPKVDMMRTKNGKEVKVSQTTYSYGYENAWTYSQEVPCKDGYLDYLKGKVATPWYTEISVNGKVFMYSIFAKEVRERPPSNSDPGEERFVYLIQDDDGDGIFETLAHGDEILVPNWVLK